jgi:protein TonB
MPAAGDRRLAGAIAVSLLLHGALIGLILPGTAPSRVAAPPLHAVLLPAPQVEAALPAVLHDTLSEESALADLPPPVAPPPTRAALAAARPPASATEHAPAAAGLPADHLLYPLEAVAAGIEGEVRVRITLDAAGAIAEASIARGSGHAVLDAAALRAAYAVGRLPGAPAGEALLPVIFRLR